VSTSSLNLSGVLSSINNAFNGKTSGIDVSTLVSEIMQVERQPETQMVQQQTDISNQVSLLTAINSDLQNLATATQALTDTTGALNQKTVASSSTGIVTATADSSAAVGNHTVTVAKLATVSSTYSNPVPSNTSLAGSEIDVSYGDPNNPSSTDKIVIPASDTTLQQAVDYINSSQNKFGVTASLVTDTTGSRLALVSKTSGAAGNLTVTSPALTFSQGTAGVDAQLTVDGVPIDSATNTVTGAIPGVTLNLAGAAPNTPATLTVAVDSSQVTTAINNFISAYNTVVSDINNQFSTSVSNSGNEGPLAGDTSLRGLQSQLLNAITFSTTGTGQYVNLQSLGIEMQDDGTLKLNSPVLNDAVSNHFADVQNFFQSVSPQGFGNFFNSEMTQLTNSVTGRIAVDLAGLSQTSQSLSTQISDFEVRMTSMQQQLLQQYSALNALLEEYPIQMQQVAAQLNSLPGATTSSTSSSSLG
jgi:flagellar hook-associated protein 2